MGDLGVIDRFMAAFIHYIDSGFGLLSGDVAFLTSVLVGIDITLAGLFWALGGEDDVIARLLKKILYVGAFALILGHFSSLADIVFHSFAGLGITAGGGTMDAQDLFRPGFVASAGFDAAWPLLTQASEHLGITSFFENFLTIAILLIAWLFVIAAFFILSIQLFVTIIEFKLTTLAGFVLVPFALWNRTGFLAERVLGNVISSGIKVMVLAVIVGIGSGFFSDFTGALGTDDTDVGGAMSLVLASLSLLGLGLFGPSIASGLVAGAPQLGAGAAFGTAAAGFGGAALVTAASAGAAKAVASGALAATRAGATVGAAASTSYKLGQETSGSNSIGAGLGGIGRTAAASARRSLGEATGLDEAIERGERAAFLAQGPAAPASAAREAPPAWALRMRSQQTARHHAHVALQAVRDGDRGGGAANPDISEKEA
ncbi:MAG TPA: P-type conjugative transfer protein TrbL [Allosphingosinicella sp.]|nr:P-type conjugative transfer protein TrbL [Allosphingosinicella sp.]